MTKKSRLKHSEESIRKAIFELYNDDYKLISFQSGNHFIVRHKCGREYPTKYDTLIKKRCQCKSCINTNDKFQRQLDELYPNIYQIIGQYEGNTKQLLIEWVSCKHQYHVLASSILKCAKCPICQGKDKKNTERFIQEVQKLEGDKYSVIGKYINTHIPVLLRHNTCENTFPVLRKDFMNGKRCPTCSKKTSQRTRWTTVTFTQKVQELEGEEYEIRSPYVNSKTHIDFYHVKCGRISPISPGKFLQGNRCRYCYGSLGFDHEWFLQKIKELVEDKFLVLSLYKSMHKPVRMEHVICGHSFPVEPNNFIRSNTRCPKCSGNQKKTTEQFKKEVYNLVGEEYVVLGEYINTNTPINIKHQKCGNIYPVTPANFLRDRRCALCIGKAAKTNAMFQKEVFDLVGDEYLVLGNYVDSNTHIELQHKTCEYIFPVVPHSFLSGSRCPSCNEYKGQRRIVEHLKTRNFQYEVEYKIPGGLRLDVAVYDAKHPGKILAVFEFQGEQHFKPVPFYGGKEKFHRQILNDQTKRTFCMKNGILLIIIPHWEYNQIEKIINKFI